MENIKRSWKRSWKVLEFQNVKRVRTLLEALTVNIENRWTGSKKSKILITCQKITFGELSSKILLKLSETLLFLRNLENRFCLIIMQKSASKLNNLLALAFKQFATPEKILILKIFL